MTTFKCTTHIHPIFNPAHFQYLQLQWNDISHLNFRLFNSTVVEFGPILAGVAGRGWWCLKTGLVSGREGGGGATRCNPKSGDLEISIREPLFMLSACSTTSTSEENFAAHLRRGRTGKPEGHRSSPQTVTRCPRFRI